MSERTWTALALIGYGVALWVVLFAALLMLTTPPAPPPVRCQLEYVTLAGQSHGSLKQVCQGGEG